MERGNILLKLGKIDEAIQDYESLVCKQHDILILMMTIWSSYRQQMVIRMVRNS